MTQPTNKTNEVKQVFLDEVRESADALRTGLDFEPFHRITKDQFERTYLPILRPLLEGGDINAPLWISKVEHPFIGLEVFNGEELIFSVPSLLKPIGTASSKADVATISEVTLDLPSLVSDSPMMSKSIYQNRLRQSISQEDRDIDREGLVELGKVADFYRIEGPYQGLVLQAAKAGVEGAVQEEPESNIDEWEDC